MPENKKIRNATPLVYQDIHFKSKLEVMVYATLKEAGFPVEYEPEKFILWEGYKPSVPFFNKDKKTRMLKQDTKKLLNITYTPDFVFKHNGWMVIIEVKGFENDSFPYKKKLFRKWLEDNAPQSIYFELYSKKQLLQAIEIIKNLKEE